MAEKVLTLICLCGGTLLTYSIGKDIFYYLSPLAFIGYTVGILTLSAGIRSLIKSMEYKG